MFKIALISDIDAQTDPLVFSEVIGLCQVLKDLGHQVSFWTSLKNFKNAIVPKGVQVLAPFRNWNLLDSFRIVPMLAQQGAEIYHVVSLPRRDQTWNHPFTSFFPIIKSFSQPLLVSHFYSWNEPISFSIKQLLHLSDVVLAPSESLCHFISSDAYSTSHQKFHSLPLLSLSSQNEAAGDFDNFRDLRPFIYLPGGPWEWEPSLYSLDSFFNWIQGWRGILVFDSAWTRDQKALIRLQSLAKSSTASLYFPDQIEPNLHTWFLKNSEFNFAAGLGLHAFSLFNSFTQCLKYKKTLLLPSSFASGHWQASDRFDFFKVKALGPLVEQSDINQKLADFMKPASNSEIQLDPANILNRIYSQGQF